MYSTGTVETRAATDSIVYGTFRLSEGITVWLCREKASGLLTGVGFGWVSTYWLSGGRCLNDSYVFVCSSLMLQHSSSSIVEVACFCAFGIWGFDLLVGKFE